MPGRGWQTLLKLLCKSEWKVLLCPTNPSSLFQMFTHEASNPTFVIDKGFENWRADLSTPDLTASGINEFTEKWDKVIETDDE